MTHEQLEEIRLRANIQYVEELGGNLKEGSIEKDRYIEGYVAGAMSAAEANAALEQERENLQTTVDMDLVYMRLVEAERDAAGQTIDRYAGMIFSYLGQPGLEGGLALAEERLKPYLGATAARVAKATS